MSQSKSDQEVFETTADKQERKKHEKTFEEKLTSILKASAFTVFTGMPLETAKIRMQTSETPNYWKACEAILKEQGIQGFWRGGHYVFYKKAVNGFFTSLSITALAEMIAPFYSKELLEKHPSIPFITAAPASAFISTFVSQMFDRMRHLSTTSTTPVSAATYISESYGKEGIRGIIRGLYQGYTLGYTSKLAQTSAFHMSYDVFADAIKDFRGGKVTSADIPIIGGLTGAFVSSLTTPASTLFTHAAMTNDTIKMRQVFDNVLKSHGPRGLYRGGLVHLYHGIMNGIAYSTILSGIGAKGFTPEDLSRGPINDTSFATQLHRRESMKALRDLRNVDPDGLPVRPKSFAQEVRATSQTTQQVTAPEQTQGGRSSFATSFARSFLSHASEDPFSAVKARSASTPF